MKLRYNLGEILDRIANTRERCPVKRSGMPAAVLMRLADYENPQERVDTWLEQQRHSKRA